MRERLTAAFVVLAVALLLGAGVVRAFVLRDLIREQETVHVHQEAVLAARVVADRLENGERVDRSLLAQLVAPGGRLEYTPQQGRPVVVETRGYDATGSHLSATATRDGTTIRVARSARVVRDLLGRDLGSLVVLFLAIALVAGAVGYAIAVAMSRPFRRLAAAASALGRGRSDLDLPRSRIPEARAIASALHTSAGQLEGRLRRERDFAQHASHVLRTPLTGLRLELEELSLHDDLPADARATLARGIDRLEQVDAVTGELVALSRRGSLVEGAELRLADLATQIAQRWTDRLAERERRFSAAVEGDLEMRLTPGPVEHVLDLVLDSVLGSVLGSGREPRRNGRGSVRLVFDGSPGADGQPGHLRVHVRGSATAGDGLDPARAAAVALGGRVDAGTRPDEVVVLLPQR